MPYLATTELESQPHALSSHLEKRERLSLPGGGDGRAAAPEPDGPASAGAPLAAAGWAPALPSTAEVSCRQAVLSLRAHGPS